MDTTGNFKIMKISFPLRLELSVRKFIAIENGKLTDCCVWVASRMELRETLQQASET